MTKLLIIDDDVGLTKAYARIGEDAGFAVAVVNNPLKATEAFLAIKPNIVVIDMIMPEKDGIEVMNEILQTGEPTRFIVTSGHGDAMLRLAQSLAAFHDSAHVSVLKKPIRRAELTSLLMESIPD
jgi:DNA-binding NtrC family response regulator